MIRKEFLLLAIIILLITIYIFIYSQNSKNKRNKKIKQGIILNNKICDIDSTYEDGICKNKTYTPCELSSDCISTDLCFNGYCIPKPTTYNQKMLTYYDMKKNRLILDRHVFILDGNIILPIQWDIYKCRWICKYSDDIVAILCDRRLYLIDSGNLQIIEKFKIRQNFDTIYKQGNHLYATGNGYKYILQFNDGYIISKIIKHTKNKFKKNLIAENLYINKHNELLDNNKIIYDNVEQIFLINDRYWIISGKGNYI